MDSSLRAEISRRDFTTLTATNAACYTTFYFLILSNNVLATIVHFQTICPGSIYTEETHYIILLIEEVI